MKKMGVKKAKKHRVIKSLLFIILFSLSFIFTINYLVKKDIDLKGKDYVNFLVENSYKNKTNYSFIIDNIIKIVSDVDTSNPTSFLTFSKNLSSKKEIKEEYVKEDNYEESDYKNVTNYIVNNSEEISEPIVYIYNTHQLETYSDVGLENSGMTPNVMMASSLLSEKLNKLGIKTIWEDTNMYEFIKTMGLPSDELYGASRVFISNAREKYPTLKYFIDLHRDSVNKEISSININGINYARILFVLGITNETHEDNRVVENILSDKINEGYPKLSRGIYEIDTPDWYEAYNQDVSSNAILIELGAKENTMNEVLNSIDVLSKVLSDYIKGDNDETN